MNITGSPDISVLDFLVAFNISGATPKIDITNNSTGAHLNNCTWWYVITTPSNTPIHTGTVTSPDKSGVWAPFTVPYLWPVFDTQIEYSDASSYVITLYVKDSANTTYELRKTALITRANGNTCKSLGNFGVASVLIAVSCSNANIKGIDSTNYAYQKQLAPTSSTNKWTLSYPMDSNGNNPANYVANNTPNVLMPVGYSSKGYQIYFTTTAIYTVNDGVTVIVAYKFRNDFGVFCNVDLCPLINQIQGLYNKLTKRCGISEEIELRDKLLRINTLLDMVFIGIDQPLCNVDIAEKIEEIKKIGGFDCNCFCSTGVNQINTINPSSGAGGCCPISKNVIDKETGNAPSNCPGSFFPANVRNATDTATIGIAYNANDMVSIMNADSSWQEYGIAFVQGNCKIGWFLNNSSVIPPDVKVIIIPDVNGGGGQDGDGSGSGVNFQQDIYLRGTNAPPPACPDSFYPANVWNYGNTAIIGLANNPVDLVSILNADISWNTFATYFVLSNCMVGSNLKDPNNIPVNRIMVTLPDVNNNEASTVNKKIVINGTQNYPTACPSSFYPARVYTPDGVTLIGIANNITDLVSLLNSNAAWQAFGVAQGVDNCNVKWTLINANNIPPNVPIDTNVTSTTCVDNAQNYQLIMSDVCITGSSITISSYPLNVYADFGAGAGSEFIGNFASQALLIIALNAFASKPATVTFSAGSAVDIVKIKSTSCNPPITLTATGVSTDFLLHGVNHSNLSAATPTKNGYLAISLKTTTLLGRIPGSANAERIFHVIKLSNGHTVAMESSTGKVFFYDNSNPRMPWLYKTVQLNTVISGANGNFTGTPLSSYKFGSSASPTLFSLYSVTDYFGTAMFDNQIYIFEAKTGTGWHISATTGVIHSFQDQQLIGRVPRVLLNNTIYFTQDGNLSDVVGLGGVTPGKIVTLDVTNFNAGGITQQLIMGSERVWAASYNGANIIYFVGESGTVVEYSVLSGGVTATHSGIFPPGFIFHQRVNVLFYMGKIYCTSVHQYGYLLPKIDTATWTVSEFMLSPPSPFTSAALYNFLPLGNCLAVVTYNAQDPSVASNGCVALYKMDGTYVGNVPMDFAADIYNVVAFPNQTIISPNSFIPL